MTDPFTPQTRGPLHLRALDGGESRPRSVRHRGARAARPGRLGAPAGRPRRLRRQLPRQRPRARTARPANERDEILKRFRRALDATGMHVPMVTTNLFWRPVFKEGAFTANDPRIRRLSVKKACEATELGAELGADVFVLWGGREGMEAEAAKDVRLALDRYKEAIDLICEHITDRGLGSAHRAGAQAERAPRRHSAPDRRSRARLHRDPRAPRDGRAEPGVRARDHERALLLPGGRPGAVAGQALPHRPQRPADRQVRPGLPVRLRGDP